MATHCQPPTAADSATCRHCVGDVCWEGHRLHILHLLQLDAEQQQLQGRNGDSGNRSNRRAGGSGSGGQAGTAPAPAWAFKNAVQYDSGARHSDAWRPALAAAHHHCARLLRGRRAQRIWRIRSAALF